MNVLSPETLFDLRHTAAQELLALAKFPWEILPKLRDFIIAYGQTLSPEEYDHPGDGIWIAKSASVAPSAAEQVIRGAVR